MKEGDKVELRMRHDVLHWPGEPERICKNCEHFDRKKRKPDGSPGRTEGPCSNGISGTLNTKAQNRACHRGFYPNEKLFPVHERLAGQWAI